MRADTLNKAIMPYLEEYESCVSACGIRYGSVAYLAFGAASVHQHEGRADVTHYPVELEIGADSWVLSRDNINIVDSGFGDVGAARHILDAALIGQEVMDITLNNKESRITLSGGIVWSSLIESIPSSGFLYSFHVEKGPTWETVDGKSMLG